MGSPLAARPYDLRHSALSTWLNAGADSTEVADRAGNSVDSFGVLAYYAIANASAWTLTPAEGRPARVIPAVGLVGCLGLAFALPVASVISGAAVLAVGGAAYGIRRTATARRES